MTSDKLLIPTLMAIAGLVSLSVILLLREARTRALDARVARAVFGDTQAAPLAGLAELLQKLGGLSRRFYSSTNLENLRGIIAASGFNHHRLLPLLLGAKGLLMVLLPAVAIGMTFVIESPYIKVIVICVGLGLGIGVPESILGVLRRHFVAAIRRGVPDALDLLVVCSESGMGLESALERVSQEMRHSNPPTATVLSGLLDDLRVLPNRRDAFTNLSRYGVVGLQRLGTMLSQSMQYGTPISNALRAVAEELRRERMNLLEEQAVKLPAKLIFPLILFILPTMWIVLLGSSLLHLADSLSTFSHTLPHH
jgi:tight adherence protein C